MALKDLLGSMKEEVPSRKPKASVEVDTLELDPMDDEEESLEEESEIVEEGEESDEESPLAASSSEDLLAALESRGLDVSGLRAQLVEQEESAEA